jgi:hypothetical protein
MSSEWSGRLGLVPRQHYVIAFKHTKYAPRNDDVVGAEHGIRIAPRPDQMLPKSIAHSSVIADVVVRKFVDGFLTNAFALLCAFIPGSTLNLVQLTDQCHHLMSRSRVLAAVRRLDNR